MSCLTISASSLYSPTSLRLTTYMIIRKTNHQNDNQRNGRETFSQRRYSS